MLCESPDLEVVCAKSLSKEYRGLWAVDNVSFCVCGRECFGILGRNGAGKSSLMRMIACVSPKSAGSLRVFARDVDLYAPQIKHCLGIVSQEESLDVDLSVWENLFIYARFFGIPRKLARERIPRLLEFMGLEKKVSCRVRELSGGMRRCLMILRALIPAPRMLVLDEPTVALDPQLRQFIWRKLRDLQALGIGIIVATHYMEEAFQICDRVMILDNGRVLALDAPENLLAHYVKPYVLELSLENSATLQSLQDKLPSHFDLLLRGDSVCVYGESRELLETLLADLHLQYSDAVLRQSHLEDVFLKVTGHSLHDSRVL